MFKSGHVFRLQLGLTGALQKARKAVSNERGLPNCNDCHYLCGSDEEGEFSNRCSYGDSVVNEHFFR
jgi:hypothetical protein